MKHLKLFEKFQFAKWEVELYDKLLNCFKNLFSQMGYSYTEYDDDYSIEFYKNSKYFFALTMKKGIVPYLVYAKSLANENEIKNFIPEYLKTIKGLKHLQTSIRPGQKESYHFSIVGFLYTSNDLEIIIDKIISQISLEDFELKLKDYLLKKDAEKYNL